MNQGQAYKRALELASTSRYREAQKILTDILTEQPDHVEALILLGKVEYYLKQYSSSCRQFETALTYEPGNLSAFFGIQYYKERKYKHAFLISFILFFGLFISGSILFYNFLNLSITNKFMKLQENVSNRLDTYELFMKTYTERLNRNVNDLSEMVRHRIDSKKSDTERFKKAIHDIRNTQNRLFYNYDKLSNDLAKQIEEIKKELGNSSLKQ